MKKHTISALVLLIASVGSVSAYNKNAYVNTYDGNYEPNRQGPVETVATGTGNAVANTGRFAGDVVAAPFRGPRDDSDYNGPRPVRSTVRGAGRAVEGAAEGAGKVVSAPFRWLGGNRD